jgi:pilus assembly protein CpaC
MSRQVKSSARSLSVGGLWCAACSLVTLCLAAPLAAQDAGSGFAVKVQAAHERLEMTVNTSRVLEFGFKVPKLFVNNPELIRATPLSPTQVQVSAVKAGVTQVNVWDEDGKITTVDLMIFGDARELQALLSSEFPDASLKVRPLPTSVLISGFVPRSEDVGQIVRLAEDYYPKVITQIKVAGVQQIQVKCKVFEVSRTKLDAMGFDWASLNDSFNITQQAAGIFNTPAAIAGIANTDTVRFGTLNGGGGTGFTGMLELLQRNQLAKLMSEPKLITTSGRPARFLVGGQVPITVAQGLGTISVQFRDFGTSVDVVPIALGNGRIRLEVRPEVSEIDPVNSVTLNGTTIPGFRTRNADVGVELNAGETMAIAGLIQNRVDTSKQGLPWLSDLPWVGAAFRRTKRSNNEVELVILVTPEFVGGMQPEEVPECMPGTLTDQPSDCELYWRGYMEVPKCGPCTDCEEGEGQVGGDGYGVTPAEYYREDAPAAKANRYPATKTSAKTTVRQASSVAEQTTTQQYALEQATVQKTAKTTASQPRRKAVVKPVSTGGNGYQANISDEPAMIGPTGYDSLK